MRELLASINNGYPPIDAVAHATGISVRSLQRKLAEEDLSYSRLLEDVRLAKARSLLRTTSLPIGAVSKSLGYSDPAAFTRAFKRWTGMTPRSYRTRMAPKESS